jgi:PAS domain S-box-containing protein
MTALSIALRFILGPRDDRAKPGAMSFWSAYRLFPRITHQLVRSIVMPAAVLTVLASLCAMVVTHVSMREQAKENMISRVKAYVDTTIYIADTRDLDFLELLVSNFIQAPNVTLVEVTLEGLPRIERRNQEDNSWGAKLTHYEVTVDIPRAAGASKNEKPIGQLRVAANYSRLNEGVLALALANMFFVLIVSFTLVFLVFLFVRRNAIAPLLQFASFVGGAQARQVIAHDGETETDAFFRFCREQVVQVMVKEAQHAALISNVPGIAVRSRGHAAAELLWISDGIESILGIPASRVIGPNADMLFRELFHPDDMEGNRTVVRNAVANLTPFEFKMRVRAATGNYRWMLARGRPFVDVSGDTITETLLVDIDDQVRKELALEESERKLSATLDNVAGIAVRSRKVNGEYRAVWVNDGVEAVLGFPAHTLVGPKATMRLRDLFHPDEEYMHTKLAAEKVDKLMPYEFKMRLRHANGDYKWMLVRGRPTVDPSGEHVTETLLVDIDEQVKKEHWLAAVVAALDSSQDRIFVVSEDHHIIYANRAAETAAVDEKVKIVGARLNEVFPDTEPNARQLYRQIRKSVRKHGQWRDIITYNRAGGVSTIHDVRVAEIPGGGLLYATTDITDLKARDAREAELQIQLAETQKLESLGRLAGGVAHDFNNILAATRAFADLIASDTQPGSRPHSYAGRIVTACQRAANLVGQILTFSRAQDAVRELVRVADAVTETESILRGRLPSHTTLHIPTVPQDLFLLANPGQVAQIILNLVINASDALNGRAGKVVLTTQAVKIKGHRAPFAKGLGRTDGAEAYFYASAALKPGRDYICLTCKDNGSGIPVHLAAKIFDPFFTTKEKRSGSGLGLAVVNSIVAAHEGIITVRSRVGAGTTFDIYLPAHVSALEDANEPAVIPKSQQTLNGIERVLVVDDEVDVADGLALSLARLGYEVTMLTNPQHALEKIQTDPLAWDVLISDQIMPQLRGLDLIQLAKVANPKLKAILCTGFSDQSGEEGALQRGADLFFMKPAPVTAVAAGIRQLMDARR